MILSFLTQTNRLSDTVPGYGMNTDDIDIMRKKMARKLKIPRCLQRGIHLFWLLCTFYKIPAQSAAR